MPSPLWVPPVPLGVLAGHSGLAAQAVVCAPPPPASGHGGAQITPLPLTVCPAMSPAVLVPAGCTTSLPGPSLRAACFLGDVLALFCLLGKLQRGAWEEWGEKGKGRGGRGGRDDDSKGSNVQKGQENCGWRREGTGAAGAIAPWLCTPRELLVSRGRGDPRAAACSHALLPARSQPSPEAVLPRDK